MIAAIYARVSTDDKGQDPLNQVTHLEQLIKARGWEQWRYTYIDFVSGSGEKERSGFESLMQSARQGSFQVVVFWALDRFSREGVWETIDHLRRLESYGVGFLSYTEQYLDSTGVFKDAIVAILAAIAKQERTRISERVKAGRQRKKAQAIADGMTRIPGWGRPLPPQFNQELFELAHQNGKSYRQMAGMFQCSKTFIAERVQELKRAQRTNQTQPSIPVSTPSA